jgi:hypothetical protein
MGQTRSLRCSGCSYQANVSGGDDAGMVVTTTPVSCSTCRRLFDVVTGEREDGLAPIPPRA